jgi:hypothetical protein
MADRVGARARSLLPLVAGVLHVGRGHVIDEHVAYRGAADLCRRDEVIDIIMAIPLIFVSWFVSLALGFSDQSMRALAEKHQSKVVEKIRGEHFDPRTPEDLVTTADTVIRGRIIDVIPHFTPDEREIVTDYRIVIAQVIKRDRNLDSAAQPGATRALVVRRKGGTLIEGDTRYSTLTTGFPNHADLVRGEEVLLFLSYDADEKAYYFSSGPFGVGRVRGGEVIPMAPEKEGHPVRSLGSVEAFVARLQSSVKKAP